MDVNIAMRAELCACGEIEPDEAEEILQRFCNSHFHHPEKWEGEGDSLRKVGEHARVSIPADPKRDDDLRMQAFIERARRAFRRMEKLEAVVAQARNIGTNTPAGHDLAERLRELDGPETDPDKVRMGEIVVWGGKEMRKSECKTDFCLACDRLGFHLEPVST